MKVTIEPTRKIVELVINGVGVPARVWQGETITSSGKTVPVFLFVTRIAPEVPEDDPNVGELTADFEQALTRVAAPRASITMLPMRMIL